MLYERLEKRLKLSAGDIEAIMLGDSKSKYRSFVTKGRCSFVTSPKTRQKVRKILAPRADLKMVQRKIGQFLSTRLRPHGIAHAYVTSRGIVTNARQHIDAASMLHIDLVGFFGSISSSWVKACLEDALPDFSEDEINAIVSLCCYGGCLPQGSPASPVLSNLVCRSMDEELHDLARSVGCRVTRYSDDICFSTSAAGFPRELASISCRGPFMQVRLGNALSALIARRGFRVNWGKLRFQTRPERLTVTGLSVGERVNVPKRTRQRIRAVLHQWEKHGLREMAANYRAPMTAQSFATSLRGCIAYVGQVAGKDDPRYRSFVTSFETLLARDRPQLDIEAVRQKARPE